MPTFDPDLAAALRSLQRQIDQINTSPPGPTSYGPGDHARFYGADGTTVLFEAVGGSGASVVSRGALTGMTPLLDGIRAKDDTQDGRLDGHDSTLTSHGTRLGSAESRLDGHDTTLGQHSTRITNAQSRADSAYSRAGTAIADAATAQSRADSAYSRAGSALSDAATAQARADAAYSLAAGRASDGDVSAALATAKQYTDSRINALVTALRDQGIPIAI